MFIMANFVSALAQVINIVLTIYLWVIVIRALISWVSPDPFNPIVQLLRSMTEPVLAPIRRILPPGFGIDLSPMIAILILVFLRSFLVASLFELSMRLR